MLQDVLLSGLLQMIASAFHFKRGAGVFKFHLHVSRDCKGKNHMVRCFASCENAGVSHPSHACKVQQPPACPSTKHEKLMQE